MDTFVELGTEAIQVGLNWHFYRSENERAHRHHNESMDLSKQQHEVDLQLIKQTYLMDVFLNLEQHFQQLNADLISSSKESERDMFDQRNQQYQTIILASSVMFSALSTVIMQGNLDEAAIEIWFILYSLSSAISFAFLFLSIVLCIEVISRASKFMYKRARNQTDQLQEAINESKRTMKKLRAVTLNEDEEDNFDTDTYIDYHLSTVPEEGGNGIGGRGEEDEEGCEPTEYRTFVNADYDVDKAWRNHEKKIYRFLKKREEINERAWQWILDDNNNNMKLTWKQDIDVSKITFEIFWKSRCQFWGDTAIALFYMGSIAFLFSIMIFMGCKFRINYQSLTGSILAIVLISIGMLGGVIILFTLRYHSLKKSAALMTSASGNLTNGIRKRAASHASLYKSKV